MASLRVRVTAYSQLVEFSLGLTQLLAKFLYFLYQQRRVGLRLRVRLTLRLGIRIRIRIRIRISITLTVWLRLGGGGLSYSHNRQGLGWRGEEWTRL